MYLPRSFCYWIVRQAALGEAPMLKQLQRFLKDESGAAAIEYGLIVSGISVAIIPGVKGVGQKLVAIFTILQSAV
jgi:pilus assembly protein Flp/PilA